MNSSDLTQNVLNTYHKNWNTQIIEQKHNGTNSKPKSGGKFTLFWTGSQPNVTRGTCINHNRSIKRNNKNRRCSVTILRLL